MIHQRALSSAVSVSGRLVAGGGRIGISTSSSAIRPTLISSSSIRSLVFNLNSNHTKTLPFSTNTILAQQPELQPEREFASPTSSSPSSSSPSSSGPQFSDLRGSISDTVYSSLTRDPFNYTTMSEVQARVLTLLPELSQPCTQVSAPGRDAARAQSESGEQDPLSSTIGTTTSDGLGKDMLVKARTGTGKTLAFLVPAIEARIRAIKAVKKGLISRTFQELLAKNRPDFDFEKCDKKGIEILQRQYTQNSVGTLILSPTRELATQIANEAKKLQTNDPSLNVQLLVGGQPKGPQISSWRNSRPDVVVATPGRILDLANDVGMVREALAATERLVLDEADTLLELGFRDEIKRIIDFLPDSKERVTSLFSATVSKEIRSIAKDTLNPEHRFIDCVPPGEENVHKHIPQYVSLLTNPKDLYPHVLRLIAHDQLINAGKSKVIVFLPTTKQTELFADFLRDARTVLPNGSSIPQKSGGEIYEIHSKKDQQVRSRVNERFRIDQRGGAVLVTSDVSARGVDYPGTTRVIQIGVPSSKDQYIHRIGRTGRAGKNGRADLILQPFEDGFMHYQLNDLPIQTINAEQVKVEVEELCAKFDQDPESVVDAEIFKLMNSDPPSRGSKPKHRLQDRATGYVPRTNVSPEFTQPLLIKGPLSPRLSQTNIEETIQETLQSRPDYQDRLREIFGSTLGYYMSVCSDIRASKPAVMRGLQEVFKLGMGADEEPTVSRSMMSKLGISGGRDSHSSFGSGSSPYGYGSRSGYAYRSGAGAGYGSRDGGEGFSRGGDGEGGFSGGRDAGYSGGYPRGGPAGRAFSKYGKQGRNGPGGYGGRDVGRGGGGGYASRFGGGGGGGGYGRDQGRFGE